MKKMKKFWALALAFVLAVTLLPIMGNKVEAATVEQNVGFYRYYWTKSGSTLYSEKVGTPVVEMTTGQCENVDSAYVTGALSANKASVLWTSDYKDSSITVESQGQTKTLDAAYKMSSSQTLTFTAPCDGTVEIYAIPRSSLSDDVNLVVNGENFGETMTLPSGQTTYADGNVTWKYTMDVEKGKGYVINSTKETGIAQISFIPSPVSALGASYRDTTEEHGNGIRFGSTIDKTTLNDGITESGTLVALKSTMEAKSVTELTMDSVGTVCKKVVRTTHITDNDSTLEYAAAIVNISDTQKDTVLVARSYVVVGGVTYYGSQTENTWNGVQAAVSELQ